MCNKLIIVASGTVLKCSENLIRRRKKEIKDVKFKNKSVTTMKKISISDLRRNNLIDYELVEEN